MAVTLGKDTTITGVSNVRSVSVDGSGNQIDITKIGDTVRHFRTAWVEMTCEIECVDDPGVDVGDTFTLSGTAIGNQTYMVTSVVENQPLEDIVTFTVSAARTTPA